MKCPWCGRENLNVYAYCQGCGRGFAGPVEGGFEIALHAENLRAWFSPPAGIAPAPGWFWPVVAAAAALALGAVMLWEASGREDAISTPVLGAVLGFTVLAALGWAVAAWSHAVAAQPAKPSKVLTQAVVVRFVAGTPADKAEDALRRAVERGTTLTRLSGLRRAGSRLGTDGSGLLGLTWHDGSSLPSQADVARAVQAAVEALAGAASVAAVEAFEPQGAGTARPPQIRMSATAALALLAALGLAGLAASAGYAAF